MCDCVCCKGMRPGESEDVKKELKKIDATVVYSEYDEAWVHATLLPTLKSFNKPYKIHLMTSYHKGLAKIDKDQLEKLKSSKRIILIFSKYFIREEWKSETFQSLLMDICANDPHCVIIPINVSDLTNDDIQEYVEKIQEGYDDNSGCSFMCSQRCKNSLKLNDVEYLHSGDFKFAENLSYLMPIKKAAASKMSTTDSSHLKRDTGAMSPFSLGIDSDVIVSGRKETSRERVVSAREKSARKSARNDKLTENDDETPVVTPRKNKQDDFMQSPDVVQPFKDSERNERKSKKQASIEVSEKVKSMSRREQIKEFLSPESSEFEENREQSKRYHIQTIDETKIVDNKTPRSSRFVEPEKKLSLVMPVDRSFGFVEPIKKTDTHYVDIRRSKRSPSPPTRAIPIDHGLMVNIPTGIIPVVSAEVPKKPKTFKLTQDDDLYRNTNGATAVYAEDDNIEVKKDKKKKRKHKKKSRHDDDNDDNEKKNDGYNIMPARETEADEDTAVYRISLKK